jgi:MOSC domain-containing protein YiiM
VARPIRPQPTSLRTMPGSVVQINVSRGGIPKRAIASGEVTSVGIVGDVCSHPQFHGGPTRALLLITSEGIEELAAMGFPLYHGALGENLTTRGIDRRSFRLGQRYRVGNAVIELTSVRGPCDALSVYGPGIQKAVYDARVKSGDPTSPLWGLSGFYTSVLRPGTIHTGDPISLLEETV